LHRFRFAGAYALLLLVAASALVAVAMRNTFDGSRGGGAGPRCGDRIPTGESFGAAWRTTSLFVADVVLNRDPVCGYDLGTKRLRGGRSRAEWAHGAAPVRPFATRYPPVAIQRASRDPAAPQAVYILSRRVREVVVVGERGEPQIPMMVGLAAPDAGLGAYNLVLVVEDGNWRVDRLWRVYLSPSLNRVTP
jgi:hypothetical protein